MLEDHPEWVNATWPSFRRQLEGAALMIAGLLAVIAIRKPSKRVKTFALIGAAVTFVIGALLFLGLA